MVGATEQDLKIEGVVVLQCFGASYFSLSHRSPCLTATSFLNLSAPFSHSNLFFFHFT